MTEVEVKARPFGKGECNVCHKRRKLVNLVICAQGGNELVVKGKEGNNANFCSPCAGLFIKKYKARMDEIMREAVDG